VVAASEPVPTRGFTVDTSQRNDVVAFYQRVFRASEGYRARIGWTGNYTSTAAGAEGTVSDLFVGDVERRLNYYRALCGLPAEVRVNTGATVNILPTDAWQPAANTTKAAAAQRSALMIVRTYPNNGGLSHNPAQSATGWTTAAWNANKNGNLALGFYGPGAIDAYVREDVAGISNWNVDVGHRRWLLSHWSTDFATGDTPGNFNAAANTVRPPSNATYVVPKASEVDFDVEPDFYSYPAAGYFPAEHNSPFWSLSHPEADFSSASVTLRDAAGNPLPVTVVSRRTGFGDNALVWQVPGAAAVSSVAADLRWQVTVSGIQGSGVAPQHSYEVVLIDPDRLNEAPVVTGPASPLATGASYQITGAGAVDEIKAGMFLRLPANWTEGAEASPAPRVTADTSGTYAFLATDAGYVKSGQKAFRLTFPTRYDPQVNGVPAQSFELDRELLPGAAASLQFHYRRGLMTGASKLAVEVSADSGRSWTAHATYSGIGGSGDPTFQAASVSLPASTLPLRVRFRYFLSDPSSALYAHEDYPKHATGIFIDDISLAGGDWLEPRGTLKASGLGSFNFNAATAGAAILSGQTWWLRARAHHGGHAFPWGPPMVVAPVGPLQLTGTATPPVSGANYAFIADPAATSYRFEVSAPGGSAWTEGAESSPAPSISAQTSGSYSIFSDLKGFRNSGGRAFRLGLSTAADSEDAFTIERESVPTLSSALEFWCRRGPLSTSNRLDVEISADNGTTWTVLRSLPGLKKPDKKIARQSVPLAAWAGQRVKFRFALRNAPGGKNLKWNAAKSGIWLDDITVTSPSAILWSHETELSATATTVRLDALSAGRPLVAGETLQLRLRGMNGALPGAWGPALLVTPVDAAAMSFALWEESTFPGHAAGFEGDANGDGVADGIHYAFSTDAVEAPASVVDRITVTTERMEIARDLAEARDDVRYGAEWSDDLDTWSDEGVEIRFEDGQIIASVTRGTPSRVMRWVVLPE
jgi:hypothetical protein